MLIDKWRNLNRSEKFSCVSIILACFIFVIQIWITWIFTSVYIETKHMLLNKKFTKELHIVLRSNLAWSYSMHEDLKELSSKISYSNNDNQKSIISRMQYSAFNNCIEAEKLDSMLKERFRALNDYKGDLE